MIIKSIKTKSKLSRMNVVFKSGSKVEFGTRFNFGTAHLLEHMMFKGTAKRNAIEISRSFSNIGAVVNAHTSSENICFELTVLTENLEEALEIFSDMIMNPTFPEEEFEKEKNVVLQEESEYSDDMDTFFATKGMELMVEGHLSVPIIGYSDTISKITRSEIVAFKNRFCNISQATICLASSLHKADAKNVLEKYFGKASGRISVGAKVKPVKFLEPKEHHIERSDISHSYIDIVYPSFKRGDPKNMALGVASSILGGGMDSRLFTAVREEKGLVYSIFASRAPLQDIGMFHIHFSCIKDNVEEVMATIDETIQKALSEGFTEDELERSKLSTKMFICEAEENESYRIKDEMSKQIFGTKSYSEKYKILEKTTIQEVNDVFSEVLSGERFVFVFGEETEVSEDDE